MNPQQQPSRSPSQQRAPYISDFVSAPGGQAAGGGTVQAAPAQIITTPPAGPAPALPPTAPNAAQTVAAAPNPEPTGSSGQSPNTNPGPENQPKKRSSFSLSDIPDASPRSVKPAGPRQGWRDALSILAVLASALLLAFCLITFVFQSYQVDGPSMQTTLENNDHLIVWKVPKTVAKLTGHHYIPNRGDIIIFSEPGSEVGGIDKQLIKRVLALPGEHITVKDNTVTVYNKEFPNGFNPDKTLPYGNVITATPGNVDVTLKENEVFVAGDNRTNSLDSRVFGPITSNQIVGKLVLRALPLNTIKTF